MARRTNTDAIRDLERNVAVLEERLDRLGRRVERLEHSQGHTIDRLSSAAERAAVLEERVRQAEDRLNREESRRHQMSLLFLGAFVSFLASLATLVLNLFLE
jgi:hypothetical protein